LGKLATESLAAGLENKTLLTERNVYRPLRRGRPYGEKLITLYLAVLQYFIAYGEFAVGDKVL
jgi:hypothetical protein